MLDYIVLITAGFAAGILNAVAGGGTFLSFPALVWVGVPPIMANATSTLAATPGYISSAWAFRHDVRAQGALSLRDILAIAVLGGFLGALLLLVTSPQAFSAMVPWLLLLATVLFAAGPWLLASVRRKGGAGPGRIGSAALLLAVTIYGGYFNGGLGIMLLAVFGLIGFTDLNTMNGLKSLISALLSVVSVATYIVAGLIDWHYVVPLAAACALGGYVGAIFARRVTNPTLLRAFITLVGVLMTIAFFVA